LISDKSNIGELNLHRFLSLIAT